MSKTTPNRIKSDEGESLTLGHLSISAGLPPRGRRGRSLVPGRFLRGARRGTSHTVLVDDMSGKGSIDTHPGWDIAVRFRVPRRAAAGAAAGGGDAARRCLFALRGGEGGLECPGASVDRSVRAGAFRFRAGAEPAAEMGGEGPELTGGGSATSLAAERVTLRDMRV